MADFILREELSMVTPLIAQEAKIYIFGCSSYFDHVCNMYKHTLNIDFTEQIDGFIDDDISKQGNFHNGKPVYSLDNIDKTNSVVIIAVPAAYMKISIQLAENGFILRHSFFTPDEFMNILMRWEHKRLLPFQNKHKGERCFIIGNGPSLKVEDLDQLKNEAAFASNKIYLMFNKTKWRPKYYFIGDPEIIYRWEEDVIKNIGDIPIFYPFSDTQEQLGLQKNSYFYFSTDQILFYIPDKIKGNFSKDFHIMYSGYTITYPCIQAAAYMGFKEIYLLGIDHLFSRAVRSNGELLQNNTVTNHFDKDYIAPKSSIQFLDYVNEAYRTAEQYSQEHGFRIYNATRGGNLEIFERVDFDSLF